MPAEQFPSHLHNLESLSLGRAEDELRGGDSLEVIDTPRCLKFPLCSFWESAFTLMKCITCGMGVLNPGDLEAHHDAVARAILLLAYRQVAQMVCSGTVEHMRLLRDHLLPLNSSNSWRQTGTARQTICEAQRRSCFSRCTWEQSPWWGGAAQNLKAGVKRRQRETEMVQQFVDGPSDSSGPEGLSKRSKHWGHRIRGAERQWLLESGHGYRNPQDTAQSYICRDIGEAALVPTLEFLRGNEVCGSVTPGILSCIPHAFRNLPPLRWSSIKKCLESAATERAELFRLEEQTGTDWGSLPNELQEDILHRLEFKDLFRLKVVAKSYKNYIESDAFRQWRGATSSPEGVFTAISHCIKNKTWRCTGFDLQSRTWRSLPPFSPALPAPDAELFKQYSVCGHGSLMCADVAKWPAKGELVVFSPLTRKTFALPSLRNPRSPVLVHISVDSRTKSYKVIVGGCATASDEHLSQKMEVFDSEISVWEEAPDLPGPRFGLNEHQAGVCVEGVLYLVSFLEGDCGRGVVAFDVERKTWVGNRTCPIPFSAHSNTLQLVENDGKVYLFSEQERSGGVEHCVDMLEIPSRGAGATSTCQWRNVVRATKPGGRGLQVYPEHTCVSFGEGKLCVLNALTRAGVVYSVLDGKQVEVLQPPPPDAIVGDTFVSLNPACFTLQPSFDIDPVPPTG